MHALRTYTTYLQQLFPLLHAIQLPRPHDALFFIPLWPILAKIVRDAVVGGDGFATAVAGGVVLDHGFYLLEAVEKRPFYDCEGIFGDFGRGGERGYGSVVFEVRREGGRT